MSDQPPVEKGPGEPRHCNPHWLLSQRPRASRPGGLSAARLGRGATTVCDSTPPNGRPSLDAPGPTAYQKERPPRSSPPVPLAPGGGADQRRTGRMRTARQTGPAGPASAGRAPRNSGFGATSTSRKPRGDANGRVDAKATAPRPWRTTGNREKEPPCGHPFGVNHVELGGAPGGRCTPVLERRAPRSNGVRRRKKRVSDPRDGDLAPEGGGILCV